MIKTYQFRVKDSSKRTHLKFMSSQVNKVWNYCNETSSFAWRRDRKWLSEFDLCNLTSGSFKELGLPATTIQSIAKTFANSRSKAKRSRLRWRSYKVNLGWIPFKASAIKVEDDSFIFMKRKYRFWKSRGLEGKIKSGSFSQDSKGNWFINLACEIEAASLNQTEVVGIDLGLKATAVLSNGETIENPRTFRIYEEKLAKAQRANKKRLVAKIHMKIKNSRKDFLHKETTKLAKRYKAIFVGDVSSSKLTKTKLAKSVNDVSWGEFKTLLGYKTIAFGGVLKVVNENFSTVTCSSCFARSGPSGLSDLVVRNWECPSCGAAHQRDVNAAKNILNFGLGHETLRGSSRSQSESGCQKLKQRLK